MDADPASIWLLLERAANLFYDPWIFWGLPFLLVLPYELARRRLESRRRK